AWVAAVSFPLFLIHQFVGYHVIAALRAHGQALSTAIAVATVLSVALAVLIYRFVEQPLRPRIRARLLPADGRDKRAAARIEPAASFAPPLPAALSERVE